MKTKILEWDIKVQVILQLGLVAMLLLIRPVAMLLVAEAAMVGYLLLSDVLNMRLQHKSIGFSTRRKYVIALQVLYILLALGAAAGLLKGLVPRSNLVAVALAGLSPLLSAGYYLLCKRELRSIRHREFFILK